MIVLDTTVVSELMRPAPSPEVERWVRGRGATGLFTTSVTLAEVEYGLAQLPHRRRRALLEAAADAVFSAFPEQILAFDASAAKQYGQVVDHRNSVGAPIEGSGAQIASICRSHQASLATRNVKDFADTGITVIDPRQNPP